MASNRYHSINEIMESQLFYQITTPPKKTQKASMILKLKSFWRLLNSSKKMGENPKSPTDLTERSLASRLIGIRKDPDRMEYLKEYDEIGLLEVRSKELTIPKISSIDNILKSGSSALLGDNLNNDITRSIFDTSSLQKVTTMLNTLQSVKNKRFWKV